MDIATYLTPEEVETVRGKLVRRATSACGPSTCAVIPTARWPRTSSATAARPAAQAHGPLQPNELLWPDLEGREGLEKTFNEQLTGKPGVLNMTFDGKGNKTSERIVSPPMPGNNVVTTLDLHLQQALRADPRQGGQARRHRDDGPAAPATCWRWRPGRRSTRTCSCRRSPRRISSKHQRRPEHPAHPARVPRRATRRARRSRSSSARRRSRRQHHRQGRRVHRADEHVHRQHPLPQLEEDRRGRPQLRAGARAELRHLVLSGRHQDRPGEDHRLRAPLRPRARARACRCATRRRASCPTAST